MHVILLTADDCKFIVFLLKLRWINKYIFIDS